MPGKSQHGKSKKKRAKQRATTGFIPQQPVMPTPQAAAPATTPAPATRVPAPSPKMPVARYPYITAELKRIGILAGIILAILIVLAVVLS